MDSNAIFKLSYGLYVVGVKNGTGFGGSIVDAVAQVSMADPPNLILSSMKRNLTCQLIREEKEFTLSILPANVDPFIVANFGFQSARDAEKWPNVEYEIKDGRPVLTSAVACLRCQVVDLKELETHTLFITEVVDGWMGKSQELPLIYGDFLRNKKDDALAAFKKFKEGK